MAGENISLGTKLRKIPTNRDIRDKIDYPSENPERKFMPAQGFIFDTSNMDVISGVYYGIKRLIDKYYKN